MVVRKITFLVIVLLLAVSAMTGCGDKDSKEVRAVAKVGSIEIYRSDTAYKVGVEKAYGNEFVPEVSVLISLVKDSLELEVARAHKVTVKSDEVTAFKRHVDETSRAPEILAKVKGVFGDDLEAYERLYLLPKIINRKLRNWYSRNAEIHKRERLLIEKGYSLVKSGRSFQQVAKDCGLDFSTIDYGQADSNIPAVLKQYMAEGEQPAQEPMMRILEGMAEGEIYNNIAEDDQGYKVIKLLEKNGTQYKVEAIAVTKQAFRKWFDVQAGKIEVKILDEEMKKKITSKYPALWWVKEVHNEKDGS